MNTESDYKPFFQAPLSTSSARLSGEKRAALQQQEPPAIIHAVGNSSSSSNLYLGGDLEASEIGMKSNQAVIDIGRDSKGKKVDSKSVAIFCFDLAQLSRRAQFIILSGAVFSFYLVYGYMQEWIFRQEGMKPHGWYVVSLFSAKKLNSKFYNFILNALLPGI